MGLVAVSVLGFAAATTGLVREFADRQAVARVEAAGSSFSQSMAEATKEVRINARLLAERPTLRSLLRSGTIDRAKDFLTRFTETGDLDGWALFHGGSPVAVSEDVLNWSGVRSTLGDSGHGLVSSGEGHRLWSVASAPMADEPDWVVLVARRWDDARLAVLAEGTGFGLHVFDPENAAGPLNDPSLTLRLAALGGTKNAARVDGASQFVSAIPIRAVSGEIVAVAQTTLSVDSVDAPIRRLERRIAWFALLTAGLGATFAAWLSRALGRQVGDLTRAASRIGAGDLGVPVPRAGIAEVGRLASAMEDMRVRLGELTAETNRRRAEAESILAGTGDGVLAVDRERRLRYLNPQAAQRLGIDAAGAVGRFCGDVLRPRERQGGRPCERRCPILDSRFRGPSRAVEHLETAGGLRTVVVTSAPPVESASEEDAARQIVILRDETDAEAARRLRDSVVANVSHEFRTPLSAQRASLELLRERLDGIDDAATLLRSLERGTLRLTRLIDNLLESLRIEAGQESVRHDRVDLRRVVEEAREETAPLLELRHQRVEVSFPEEISFVGGDAERLLQVFVNLLSNSNKFAPEGSTVLIRGEARPGEVMVTVEDEGPGLPPGDVDQLFDRFVRATSGEPSESGLGLGLWIVRSIVVRHGGRVEVLESEHGTRIAVVLPVELNDEDPDR